jgi:hypothetical protein
MLILSSSTALMGAGELQCRHISTFGGMKAHKLTLSFSTYRVDRSTIVACRVSGLHPVRTRSSLLTSCKITVFPTTYDIYVEVSQAVSKDNLILNSKSNPLHF